jgi:conjugal transfer pilus assembly protein TraV
VTRLSPGQHRRLAGAIARRSGGRVRLPMTDLTVAEATALWRDCIAALNPGQGRRLTEPELAMLRRRAWQRSRGHIGLSGGSLTLGQGLAVWRLAERLGDLGERTRGRPLARAARIAALGLAAGQLAACTSFLGGNIKGNFVCSAPGGTCAPSTLIDDKALAVIQNARPMSPASGQPAGPYFEAPARGEPQTARRAGAGEGRLAPAGPGMVHRERRVLKVVFPSYVDGAGNFHEPRVVHTLADAGGWMELSSGEPNLAEELAGRLGSGAARNAGAVPGNAAEAQTGTGADPMARAEVVLQGLPDPRAVAQARARGLARQQSASTAPLDAIRGEVEAQLARKAKAPGAEHNATEAKPEVPAPGTAVGVEPAQLVPVAAAPGGENPAASSPAGPGVANPPARLSGRIEE